jgi:predicted DNA-binding transcriptional regulator AlpA
MINKRNIVLSAAATPDTPDTALPTSGAPKYLTGPQTCRRYGVSDMTIWRWLHDDDIGFPQPALRVRERRYWLESDLVAWERAQLPAGDDAIPESKRQKCSRSKRRRVAAKQEAA